MNNIFEWNGPFYRFLAKIVDLLLLNALFLISCLPIVTIGSALTAMYSITIKMARNEDVSIIRGYVAALQKNFKQSTIIWLILLAVGVVLYMDYYYLNQYTGNLLFLVKVSLGLFSFAYLLLFNFIFPYVARFENSVKDSIINTWKIALVHPIKTISVLMITMIPIITLWISVYSFFFLLYFCLFIGFSFFAYINTFIILHIYEGYEK
ncbi:YesL family protein [Niallia alba]|uniref:YesL family protein n=1 Tax=Niallia circulans TaxID=1397 RepID=A0A941GEE8_NIACI|nr:MULTISPECIES: YesL family protein [Niallia]MCB5238622.1 YesL family protein [Niallia circulans]MED3793734.1 YesL family protein [Niallia alba]